MLSLVIPVYKNEENLDRLLSALVQLNDKCAGDLEVVFVVDGSPDRSLEILRERLPAASFRSRLLSLSRNFGSFQAVAAGLSAGRGDYLAVLAADLQEPPDLVLQFWHALRAGEVEIVFGCRSRRADPWLSGLFSNLFWSIYRALVVKDMPRGGIDVFGCTRRVRDRLLEFNETSTNLIALLFWLGFPRKFIFYERQPRKEGRSAWTVAKKLRYCLDSIFNFTDLPVRLLLYVGIVGVTVSVVWSAVVLVARILGDVPVAGYTPLILTISFFGGFTCLGLGITGEYLWLTLQNSRGRPNFVVASCEDHGDATRPPE